MQTYLFFFAFLDDSNGTVVRQNILSGLDEGKDLNPAQDGTCSSSVNDHLPETFEGVNDHLPETSEGVNKTSEEIEKAREVEQAESFVDNFDVDEEENVNVDIDREEANEAESNSEGNWLTYAELMMDSYPSKSKINYLKAYNCFERYLKSRNQFVPNVAPTEIQILNYFHHLKFEKNLAPTTLWSTYSRVNACVKRMFGFSLKNFVRVSDVLKSYESGYKVKKASIFSPQEVLLSIEVAIFMLCLMNFFRYFI